MQRSKTTPLRSIGLWLVVAALAAGGAGFTGCSAAQDRSRAWAEEGSEAWAEGKSRDWSGGRSKKGSGGESWGLSEGGSEYGSEDWAAPSEEEGVRESAVPGQKRTEPDPAPPRAVRAETARVDPGIVTVRVDVGNRSLAAYELALRYDPEALSVTRVFPPRHGGFPAAPVADPSTFRSGATPLIGFHIGGPFPTGTVVVAVVRFKAKRPGNHAISVSVKALYSPDDQPIPGTARLSPQSVRSR